MSLVRSVVAALCLVASSSTAFAQAAPALEVPAPSSAASVKQRVGVTDFTVEYSSPAVKGRPIWGTLVPFDAMWRTGANAATKLTASRDFKIGDKTVPAGTYSVLTIPTKGAWTVILNSDPAAQPQSYSDKKDVARISVKPETMPASRERLTFLFSDSTDDTTNLDLEWEKLRVRVPLAVDTKAHVAGSIDKSLGEAWRPHFIAARYHLDAGGDLGKALEYANASIAIKSHWWNNWIKAQILAKQGKKADAIAAANAANAAGKGDAQYDAFGKAMIAQGLAEWSKK